MALRCLIIEDEPLAAEVLSDYIRQVPFLELLGHCHDAMAASGFLRKQSVDVLFLDLHLPGMKGFDFLKTLSARPQVIITTAFHQYALDGYDFDVVDYLMKPVEFARFLTAVNKLSDGSVAGNPAPARKPETHPFIFIYSDKKQVKVMLEEILYVESERDYLKIVQKDRTLIARQTMQEFEKLMPADHFLRVHRSYLVRREAINAFDSAHIEIGGKSIPIGRQYRDHVMQLLKQA